MYVCMYVHGAMFICKVYMYLVQVYMYVHVHLYVHVFSDYNTPYLSSIINRGAIVQLKILYIHLSSA